MVKNEMLKAVSDKAGVTQKEVDAVLAAFVDVVIDTLSKNKDDKIALPGIGTFKVKNVPERKGISTLGDKKEWVKPAHDEICFKLNKTIKQYNLNGDVSIVR